MAELTELLSRAVEEARFESTSLGSLNRQGLQELYRRQPMYLITVTTQLYQRLLDDIITSIKLLMPRHIEEERVGNGLAFFLQGVAPMNVEQLARDVVRTSAVLGVEPTVKLLTNWERGEPITFESHIVLDGVSVEQSLETSDGIRVVALSLSGDRLSAELPPLLPHNIGIMGLAGEAKLIVTNTARSAVFRKRNPTLKSMTWVWSQALRYSPTILLTCCAGR